MPRTKKPHRRPGRKPLRVSSGGLTWEQLSRKVSNAPRPAEGWPTPEQMIEDAKPKPRRTRKPLPSARTRKKAAPMPENLGFN